MFRITANYTIRVKCSTQKYIYNCECESTTYNECLQSVNAIIEKACAEVNGYIFTVNISVVNDRGFVDNGKC